MRLLILGGTSEASRLATALADRPGLRATVSLAGRTRAPAPHPQPQRIGGFGGADGLARYLVQEDVTGVVDATHPFAARISANAVVACAQTRVPLVAFSRGPWRLAPGDRWRSAPDIAAAVAHLATLPACGVFLTTGRLDLDAFRDAPQHRYLVRTIDPPAPESCPPQMTLVLGRGPFATRDEVRLMTHHRIDLLVTKNSGGAASEAKLAAARHLELPVLMVERPALPHRLVFEKLGDVLAWIEAHDAPR